MSRDSSLALSPSLFVCPSDVRASAGVCVVTAGEAKTVVAFGTRARENGKWFPSGGTESEKERGGT